jgi:hypothetical protein
VKSRRAETQQLDDLGESSVFALVRRGGRAAGRDVGMTRVAGQRLGDLRHRQYEVDRAGRDRAARHSVVSGLFWVLGDDQPASFADRLEPDTAVAAGPRQNGADRARSVFVCQRVQKEVERQARTVWRLRPRQPQQTVMHREICLGRNDIDTVALDGHAVGDLRYGHRRMQAEQIDHRAGMGRFEMRDQHKGDAGVRG